MDTQQSFTEEQLWQAFQYVSAEMSPQEAEAFECLMLADTDICEAVAEATRLTSLIAGSVKPPAVTLIRPVTGGVVSGRPRWLRAVASGAVCCSLILAGLVIFRAPSPSGGHSVLVEASGDLTDAEVLVNAWVDSVNPEEDVEIEALESTEAELDVPDWMIAAVTLSERDSGNGEDSPNNMEVF